MVFALASAVMVEIGMADFATPNLPAIDMAATASFYANLGFAPQFKDEGWMRLARGGLTVEFFPMPKLNPLDSWFSACFRVDDLPALQTEFSRAGLTDGKQGPRMTAVRHEHGLQIFYLVDLNGSLIRAIQNK